MAANALKVTATRVSVLVPPFPERVFVKNDVIGPESFYYEALLNVVGVVDSGSPSATKIATPRVPLKSKTPV